LRLRFLTSTPLDVTRGSGTFVGISVLARALETLGHTVDFEYPLRHFPVHTLERYWFNRCLRRSAEHDVTVGFDLDGYRIAGLGHVASLKGVIADEVRFERGLTRLTMGTQARWERLHVHRAERVITTSNYSAQRAAELYGMRDLPSVVPELIDLPRWRAQLAEFPGNAQRFTLLSVGRFYLRKRVDVLLRALVLVRARVPDVELRIVGNGPCNRQWRELAGELDLGTHVTWLGDVTRSQLAAEYNRCHVFCMPSVQEGFGIVLLEAMTACKPIVAARAGAIPEVTRYARLAAPDDPAALAEAILDEYRARSNASAAVSWVEQFDAPLVAQQFLNAIT
jgi:glycosyltransferase involved in cell wall biosynthesis